MPPQRQLSKVKRSAANVSVPVPAATPGNWWYAGSSTAPILPAPYWPSATHLAASAALGTWMLSTIFRFSALIMAGDQLDGGSMATNAMICSRWLWIMSRMAPVWS